MKPVYQTKFGAPEGNCYAACLASIFEVPLEVCPIYSDIKFPEDDDAAWSAGSIEWARRDNEFLKDFGYEVVCLGVPGLLKGAWRPTGWTILGGPGPRGFEHAVVGKGLEIAHDPHPEGGGLERIVDVTLFIALDPALGRPAPRMVQRPF